MIRRIWDRLSTFLRPDKLEIQPQVDFDPEHGRLLVSANGQVKGQTISLSPAEIQARGGKIGERRFVISAEQQAALWRQLAGFTFEQNNFSYTGDDVPAKIREIDSAFRTVKSARALAVQSEQPRIEVEVDVEGTEAFKLDAKWLDEKGRSHRAASATLKSGRVIRDGCTFYEIKPLSPQLLRSVSDEGVFPHQKNVDFVNACGERFDALKEYASVRLSAAAARLVESARNPRPAALAPSADYADGKLTVALERQNPDGTRTRARPEQIAAPLLVDGEFVQLDAAGAALGRRLKELGASTPDGALSFEQGSVPTAIELVRGSPLGKQSAAAAAIQVHKEPLQQNTYIELAEGDSLIIENDLTTSDQRTLVQPEVPPDSPPDWLRVKDEYFHNPSRLARAPKSGRKLGRGRYRLEGDSVPDFIIDELPEARARGKVMMRPADLRVVPSPATVETNLEMDDNGRVLVRPNYRSGPSLISHRELTGADRKRRYVRRGNTFHRIDWETVKRVEQAASEANLTPEDDGSFTGSALNLQEIINTFSQLGILAQSEVVRRFMERLANFSQIEAVPLPASLKCNPATIREYQRAGYDWLAFLKNHGLPGILADEMGLGKTLQVLLAVAHFKEKYGCCPSLVVCPAALVQKWADEAAKFFNGLRAVTHIGPGRFRRLAHNLEHADVIATSYETLLSDSDRLAQAKWRFVIADEAQRIKNPSTKRAQAIRKIPAEARIAVTGTPVENKLLDLWSIFDFLASGYLYKRAEFERQFAVPIEKHRDQGAANELQRRTRPFVLRRRKQQKGIAEELPDKIQKPMVCELTASQRALYQAVLDKDLAAAMKAVDGKPVSIGNPHIFAVLTKLKQVCSHPGLLTGDFKPYQRGQSGKFDAFIDLMDEIGEPIDGERPNKIVGFSQYVPMTGFLCNYLNDSKKRCGKIDGMVEPTRRPGLCDAFNSDPNYFGMMLTLGAGGVGLDLQSANYAVVYDRWWNPAVEEQAIDRVHRLGQDRNVVVITMTTRGTLEEKIEQKLIKKKGLADWVIQPEEFIRKEITREELLYLVKLDP